MRYTKEFDEKLREFLRHTEPCINYTRVNERDTPECTFYPHAIKAGSLREEIIKMIDTPQVKGKWRQTTLQEQIENESYGR